MVIINLIYTYMHIRLLISLSSLLPGGTFQGVYKKLIEYNKAGKVSFKYVKTFNQIEFVNISTNHPRSYHTYTYDNFTKHIDIDPENVFELNGNAADLVAECNDYEKKIKDAGGVEIFLAGMTSLSVLCFSR